MEILYEWIFVCKLPKTCYKRIQVETIIELIEELTNRHFGKLSSQINIYIQELN